MVRKKCALILASHNVIKLRWSTVITLIKIFCLKHQHFCLGPFTIYRTHFLLFFDHPSTFSIYSSVPITRACLQQNNLMIFQPAWPFLLHKNKQGGKPYLVTLVPLLAYYNLLAYQEHQSRSKGCKVTSNFENDLNAGELESGPTGSNGAWATRQTFS